MQHLRTIIRTWHDFLKTPLATFANIVVIGIALALPIVGYSFVKSIESLSFSLEHKPHMNVYISPQSTPTDIRAIESELAFTEGIKSQKIISKEQALEEFERSSGISNILDSLNSNPLPTTIVITPRDDFLDTDRLQQLKNQIQKIDGIDEIQINQEWLERLNAITSFAKTLLLVLAALIASAILLTLSNTIRLVIANRKDEIVISKLVGANDAYVKLPFLYLGFFYGLLGGVAAYGIFAIVLFTLQQPITDFSLSYGNNFELHQLSRMESAITILASTLLGWLAAKLSVGKHLQQIKPR